MEYQAYKISDWGENVYVKIPIMNTEEKSSSDLIRTLSKNGIKINVTAILTMEQITEAIKSLGNVKSIISIFAGRIADTGVNPYARFRYASFYKEGMQQILWASTRQLYNIIEAEEYNADIITIPHELLKKMHLRYKNLYDLSLDTVKMFYEDAKASGLEL